MPSILISQSLNIISQIVRYLISLMNPVFLRNTRKLVLFWLIVSKEDNLPSDHQSDRYI
jgi:hypothetical protein